MRKASYSTIGLISATLICGCAGMGKHCGGHGFSSEPVDSSLLQSNSFDFSYNGQRHRVYWRGRGSMSTNLNSAEPAVIILHELPGLSKECFDFGTRLAERGFTVYMPLLFGKPNVEGRSWWRSMRSSCYLLFSAEWCAYSKSRTSPITGWLSGLCHKVSEDHNGHNVGVIGNCLTGSFPIVLLKNREVTAAVISQPAIPMIAFSSKAKSAVGVSPTDLAYATRRCAAEKIQILGFRFQNDCISPSNRFCTLNHVFGMNFLDQTIKTNEYCTATGCPKAHAVLIEDYNDRECSPTVTRFMNMVSYLQQRLKKETCSP